MYPFEEYLKQHRLEPMMVSIEANVRYLTVWNALRGNPITYDHAQKIRQAVLSLTGVTYTGPLNLIDAPAEETPTIPIKKITKRNLS